MSDAILNQPVPNSYSDDEVSLLDLFSVMLHHKIVIAIVAVISLALGLTYTLIASPVYRADALIQVEDKRGGLADLDVNQLFEGGEMSILAEIEILRSRLVLGEVVDNLKLDILAERARVPVVGKALSRLMGSDQLSIKVNTLEVPDSLLDRQLSLRVLAVTDRPAGSGSVTRSSRLPSMGGEYEVISPLGEVLLTGSVGEASKAELIDGELSVFISELEALPGDVFQLTRRSRVKAIETLRAGLNIAERGKGSGILAISFEGPSPASVSRVLNELANVYVRKNVERKSAEAEKTLEFLDAQLPHVKQKMETAEVELNNYRLEKGSIDLPLETQVILESIVTVEGNLNALKQERDKVTQGFTPVHPMVVALDKQIQRSDRELDDLNEQVRGLPSTQQEVLRLVRDAEVSTELYVSLLNAAQELRVVKAGTIGNVRVVDYAVVPYEPVKPRKTLVAGVSLGMGLLLGVGLAFLKKALFGGVEDPDLMERTLGVPVYATIAYSKRQRRIQRDIKSQKTSSIPILAIDSPDDVAVESLRSLKTALHFGMFDVKNNVVMITGPSPAVGKSFVSLNLAAVLAGSDKRVVLLDADMRKGRLHENLGVPRENGMSEIISGKLSLDSAIQQTDVDNLVFIPTGTLPPNPAELLLHERFTATLATLSSRYDHVIIDSPPILAVTDAAIIGRITGATLMVLKGGAHSMREIEQAAKRLQQAGVTLRGLLVNDVSSSGHRYGAYKYNYHYSYK